MTVYNTIEALQRQAPLVWTIHYACESFYLVKDRPVAISCIGMSRLDDSAERIFSLTDSKDEPELALLEKFYSTLREHPDTILVHWNMHSSDFGFDAIANRYKYVTGREPPFTPAQANLLDLDNLIESLHGKDYISHPKLASLANLNQFDTRFMLTGREEAERYLKGEHGDVRRSTAAKVQLIRRLLRAVLEGSLVTDNSRRFVGFAGARMDTTELIGAIARRGELVVRQLGKRYDNRPTLTVDDEYDYQDFFHSLLQLFFNDIRREEWTPSYAGGSNRIDFLLPESLVAVELKYSRPSMSTKKLGEELLIDLAKYAKHPSVNHVICIVMDAKGQIENPRGIEKDLSLRAEGERPQSTVIVVDR
jgi:hypothetical protein